MNIVDLIYWTTISIHMYCIKAMIYWFVMIEKNVFWSIFITLCYTCRSSLFLICLKRTSPKGKSNLDILKQILVSGVYFACEFHLGVTESWICFANFIVSILCQVKLPCPSHNLKRKKNRAEVSSCYLSAGFHTASSPQHLLCFW